MTGQTDSDIPETGAIFTFGRSSFADNLPSKFWLKNDYPAGVCCGREHSAVITGNGKLLVFGCNSSGQLGLSLKPDLNKPASLKAFKSEKVTFVACGTDHTIVCTSNDRVYYAGKNQKARPGRGHSPKAGSFLRLHPFCERAHVKMLSAGCSTSAALTEDGRLFMWGDNSAGQIGLGDELFAAEPREVGVGEAVKWVSCGNRHSALVTVAGHLYTFGERANGRLGLQAEQLKNHRAPQRVPGIPGHVTQVCCGGQHTVVLTGEDVFTFGGGRYGQLGHGTFLFEAPSPKPLQHFHKCSVRQIACGENHTAVITNGGLLYTFGDGRHGKLGLMEENFVNQFSPTLCTQFLKFNVQSVSCGGHHMLVLAAPRPARAREVLEKENFLLSSCAELPLKEQLIDLAPVFPLSALAARARHREKVGTSVSISQFIHDSNEEEEDSEEQKGDDDSSESEVDEEKSAEEDDEEEDGSNEEEEAEETSDPENEEEEASVDDEATDDKEEEEEDGDATSEEEQEEEGTTDNEEEAEEDDEENEEEEAATEEDEEEEEDSQEDDGETKQTESDEDTDEEEDGENDKEEKSDEEGMESEEEEEEEGEEDEEEAEEDEDDEEDDESVEDEEEEVGNEEEEAEEAEYEEEEEEEEVGNEEEEVNEDEEEEEVNEDEEEEGENEEEEGEEVGNEEEEEGEQENEEEEGVEVEEEVEEEEEEEEVAQTGKDEAQKAPSLDKKPKREEAPTPAPRTKQTAVKKKQEDPQQFWNDVLPQYLDIQ
uniref:X-linked retinitis pigmentosa GTPase regulator n=1 Tax=Oryzias melastigma TaxID=30732 RepID=A0A3B3CHJ1_ORYME